MTILGTDAPLTAEDRCDRCSARAMVRATLVNGDLLFCGHHARDIFPALTQKAVSVYDPERLCEYASR
jgi:hypothetical protein